jgi:hypothetical protein
LDPQRVLERYSEGANDDPQIIMLKENPAPRKDIQIGLKRIIRDGIGNDVFQGQVVIDLTGQVSAYSDMMNIKVIFLTGIVFPGD